MSDIKRSTYLMEIETNTGVGVIDQEGKEPIVRKVMFSEDAIANIFVLDDLCKRYRVTFDSEKENTFIVELDDKRKIKFKRNDRGLYTYSPLRDEKIVHSQKGSEVGVDTVEVIMQGRIRQRSRNVKCKNKKTHVEGFTRCEVERAKRARRLYHQLGAQALPQLKLFLRKNIMRNCPVTTKDVNLVEEIYGQDAATLKGEMTRRKPKVMVDEKIGFPEELKRRNKDIDMVMDVLFINNAIFLVTIDRVIKFRAAVPMQDRTKEELYESLDIIFRHYNDAGYNLENIWCDSEFKTIMSDVADNLDVNINFGAPGDHIPDIERSNRVIEKRFRVTFYQLPFRMIP